MSKILRVNMTDLTTKFEDVPEKYKLTGGRGLTSAITCDEVPPAEGGVWDVFTAPQVVSESIVVEGIG